MDATFTCSKCGKEFNFNYSYKLKEDMKLVCSSCLNINHCHRCGTNTYQTTRNIDGNNYCSVCQESYIKEQHEQILANISQKLIGLATNKDNISCVIPLQPSSKLTFKLPFITINFEKCDASIHQARIENGVRIESRQQSFLENIVAYVIRVINPTKEEKTEKEG